MNETHFNFAIRVEQSCIGICNVWSLPMQLSLQKDVLKKYELEHFIRYIHCGARTAIKAHFLTQVESIVHSTQNIQILERSASHSNEAG